MVVSFLAFCAGLGALWFIGLQLFAIQHVCLYCMLAHGGGLGLAALAWWLKPTNRVIQLRLIAGAVLSLMTLVVLQTIGSTPTGFSVIEHAPPAPDSSQASDSLPLQEGGAEMDGGEQQLFEAPVREASEPQASLIDAMWPKQAKQLESVAVAVFLPLGFFMGQVGETSSPQSVGERENRTVRILGNVQLDTRSWPLVGSPEADFVLVELFDYTCSHCQQTHAAIQDMRRKYGQRLAVMTLPVPLNSNCNAAVQVTHASHREACELAQLAVGVWLTDSQQFEAFHDYLFATKPSLAQAKQKASASVDSQRFEEILAGTLAKQYVERTVALFQKAGAGTIPKLLFPTSTVVGAVDSSAALDKILQERLFSK
jgi:protein-disulfide isomerase